jgi:hypothetical protein
LFDTGGVDRQPVEHAPDKWRGEFNGHHIAHGKPPIPVTVHVEWVDGGEGELDGWTSQWTRTHVCIMRSLEPGSRLRPFWVRAPDVRRREIQEP